MHLMSGGLHVHAAIAAKRWKFENCGGLITFIVTCNQA